MEAFDQFRKNLHKYRYYARGGLEGLLPRSYWQRRLSGFLNRLDAMEPDRQQAILDRVNYYNKLDSPFAFPESLSFKHQLYGGKKSAAYAMDLKRLIRFFPENISYSYLFGDIVVIPEFPTFLKSRPITSGSENENSVLLKLNKVRHYYVVRDTVPFKKKVPKIVWRGKSNQPERVEVLKRFYEHPLCDVGDTHDDHKRTIYSRPFMSIPQQLQYRYVLSVEGNDVATNLKWIMASNSVCFMRKPRYETWFMEGTLVPNFHYVLLKDDYSDLEEKIQFYNDNPHQALFIVNNAKTYVKQFFNEPNELMISLLVLRKYFQRSGQL